MSVEKRLNELGITVPEPLQPVASYVMAKEHDHVLYLSGHVGRRDGQVVVGRFGAELSKEQGRDLARLVALDLLASARAELGSLDRLSYVLKVTGFVAGTPDFTDQPFVVNGASDLFVEIMGDRGKHARSAVGVASLPLGAALEIEAIVACG